jgi:hypothetical protein
MNIPYAMAGGNTIMAENDDNPYLSPKTSDRALNVKNAQRSIDGFR